VVEGEVSENQKSSPNFHLQSVNTLWENWHSDSRAKTEYDTHFFESHDKIKAQVNLKK